MRKQHHDSVQASVDGSVWPPPPVRIEPIVDKRLPIKQANIDVNIPETLRILCDKGTEEDADSAYDTWKVLGPDYHSELPLLSETLQNVHTRPFARRYCLHAIVKIENDIDLLIPYLVSFLSDTDAYIRHIAVEALAQYLNEYPIAETYLANLIRTWRGCGGLWVQFEAWESLSKTKGLLKTFNLLLSTR